MKLERPKNKEEQEEYKDLHEKTADVLFMDVLNRFAQSHTVAHKPYCRKCALDDFKMAKQDLYNEMKRKHNREFTEKEPPFMELAKNFDLQKYGEIKYFELVGESRESMQRKSGGESWNEIVVNKNFACKKYGHGCCVSISQSEMNNEELAVERARIKERKEKLEALQDPVAENKPASLGTDSMSSMPSPNPLGK